MVCKEGLSLHSTCMELCRRVESQARGSNWAEAAPSRVSRMAVSLCIQRHEPTHHEDNEQPQVPLLWSTHQSTEPRSDCACLRFRKRLRHSAHGHKLGSSWSHMGPADQNRSTGGSKARHNTRFKQSGSRAFLSLSLRACKHNAHAVHTVQNRCARKRRTHNVYCGTIQCAEAFTPSGGRHVGERKSPHVPQPQAAPWNTPPSHARHTRCTPYARGPRRPTFKRTWAR